MNEPTEPNPPKAQPALSNPLTNEQQDIVFDTINQIFHDNAFLWRYIEQGDHSEALILAERMRLLLVEIEVTLRKHNSLT